MVFTIIYYELFVIYCEVSYDYQKRKVLVFMGYYSDQEQRGIIADNLTRFISLSQKDQKDVAIDLDINPLLSING